MDLTSRLWRYTRFDGKHTDLQYSFFVFILQSVFFFLLTGSIYTTNIWFFLIMPSFMASFMKCVFFTNINYCYPVQVRSMFMALSNLLSFTILWTQRYIVKSVQEDKDLKVYFYSQLGISILVLILTAIILMRIIGCEPVKWSKFETFRYLNKIFW